MRHRSRETPQQQLLLEARSIELLLSELEPIPTDLGRYWDLSTEMINLMVEIEEVAETARNSQPDDPDYLRLKRRLRDIENEAINLMRRSEASDA